jgi:hypothetical protein
MHIWHRNDGLPALSGVPMVLNISFNHNELVLRRPVEALDCFLVLHRALLQW